MSIVPLADFSDYIRDEIGSTGTHMVTQALATAESIVQQYCARSFALAASVATARVYGQTSMDTALRVLRVHDFSDTASLVVSNNGIIIPSSNYQLEPLNGVDQTGTFTAYEQIRLLYGGVWWTFWDQRATVTITAKWGWTTVPDPVIEAVKLIGKDWIQQRDTKFGYQDTSGGPVSAGRNWPALLALAPYQRAEAFV